MNKEYVGYIVAILSVIASGIISWYFYDQSLQFKVPTYSSDPFPSVVFKAKKENDFPFKVTTNDGKPISENIYLATHYFWNNGDKPILNSDILDDLTVKFKSTNFEILSAAISKESRKVVNCAVDAIKQNEIRIQYKVLEKGDGCAIDILYIGDKSVEVDISGTIIGVDEFVLYTQTIDKYLENRPWYNPFIAFIPGILILFPFVYILSLYLKTRKLSAFKYVSNLLVYSILIFQVYVITEVKYGLGGFSISYETPNISNWVSDETANKALKRN